MAQRAQIKCINKDPREDRYHSITHVGGFGTSRWKITQADAIEKIERREWEFFTIGANGHETDVIVAERNGRKYLKTKADYDTPDNLLKLPECP
jgi:hypothetical protein